MARAYAMSALNRLENKAIQHILSLQLGAFVACIARLNPYALGPR